MKATFGSESSMLRFDFDKPNCADDTRHRTRAELCHGTERELSRSSTNVTSLLHNNIYVRLSKRERSLAEGISPEPRCDPLANR